MGRLAPFNGIRMQTIVEFQTIGFYCMGSSFSLSKMVSLRDYDISLNRFSVQSNYAIIETQI